MSCYHPLKGFRIGTHPSGKPNYRITGYDVQFVKRVGDSWINCNAWTPADRFNTENIVSDFIEIPCGHCIGCRLRYSRDWAVRCMKELEYHTKSCFITLTYDDDHIPPPNEIMNADGVISLSPVSPLRKRDLQLFMKRLRKAFPDERIRFFGCGEYGSESMRCHYHIILFGEDFSEDRVYFKKSPDGKFNYYISPTLDRLWHNYDSNGIDLGQNGFAMVCDVTFDTCAYVARYVTKKKYGKEKQFYDDLSITPEFSLMSRKPGIGRQYFDDHMDDIYNTDEVFISDTSGGRRFKPPKYYDRLYDIADPDSASDLFELRQEIAKNYQEMRTSLTSLSYLDMLKSEEMNLNAKLKNGNVFRKKV